MSRRQKQKAQEGQALGRSRGKFSTKIHLKADFDGHPIGFNLTGGDKADAPNFETLMDLGPDVTPGAVVADKGNDSRANRAAEGRRGAVQVIPYRSTTVNLSKAFGKTFNWGRARIERAVGKLKRFKPIALRCEKTKRRLASFLALAAAFVLVKSVHTA